MNDIYEKKAKKYKYKYLKLKREYIGEGGNFFNHFSEDNFNKKVDEIIQKYIIIDSDSQVNINKDPNMQIKEQDENSYFLYRLTNNGFIYQVYKRIIKYFDNLVKIAESQQIVENSTIFNRISEKGFNYQVDNRIKIYVEEIKKNLNEKLKQDKIKTLEEEHQIFKDKIQNVKNTIEKIIKPLYYNGKIVGNIDKDNIINSNYEVDINKDPKKCYYDKLNYQNSKIKNISKSDVIQILKDCGFDTLNNFLYHLLFAEQVQTDLNKNNNNTIFTYDDKYLFYLDYLKNNIKIQNYDLYKLYDIIYDLYNSLNNNLKNKYDHLFNQKNYIETPDRLIYLLQQILNINF